MKRGCWDDDFQLILDHSNNSNWDSNTGIILYWYWSSQWGHPATPVKLGLSEKKYHGEPWISENIWPFGHWGFQDASQNILKYFPDPNHLASEGPLWGLGALNVKNHFSKSSTSWGYKVVPRSSVGLEVTQLGFLDIYGAYMVVSWNKATPSHHENLFSWDFPWNETSSYGGTPIFWAGTPHIFILRWDSTLQGRAEPGCAHRFGGGGGCGGRGGRLGGGGSRHLSIYTVQLLLFIQKNGHQLGKLEYYLIQNHENHGLMMMATKIHPNGLIHWTMTPWIIAHRREIFTSVVNENGRAIVQCFKPETSSTFFTGCLIGIPTMLGSVIPYNNQSTGVLITSQLLCFD